jgi:hypothetical protein
VAVGASLELGVLGVRGGVVSLEGLTNSGSAWGDDVGVDG